MDTNETFVPIASLTPTISPPSTQQIKATIALIYPYSSATRTAAVLATEPDFRLRRKRGQVRVQFRDGAARAVAQSGIGIGDEIFLRLKGAKWLPETDDIVARTPGKSVEGELMFEKELELEIRRNSERLALVEFVDTTPQAVSQIQPPSTPVVARGPRYFLPRIDAPTWSSPAFLRGDLFTSSKLYDPFADLEEEDERPTARKRIKLDDDAVAISGRVEQTQIHPHQEITPPRSISPEHIVTAVTTLGTEVLEDGVLNVEKENTMEANMEPPRHDSLTQSTVQEANDSSTPATLEIVNGTTESVFSPMDVRSAVSASANLSDSNDAIRNPSQNAELYSMEASAESGDAIDPSVDSYTYSVHPEQLDVEVQSNHLHLKDLSALSSSAEEASSTRLISDPTQTIQYSDQEVTASQQNHILQYPSLPQDLLFNSTISPSLPSSSSIALPESAPSSIPTQTSSLQDSFTVPLLPDRNESEVISVETYNFNSHGSEGILSNDVVTQSDSETFNSSFQGSLNEEATPVQRISALVDESDLELNSELSSLPVLSQLSQSGATTHTALNSFPESLITENVSQRSAAMSVFDGSSDIRTDDFQAAQARSLSHENTTQSTHDAFLSVSSSLDARMDYPYAEQNYMNIEEYYRPENRPEDSDFVHATTQINSLIGNGDAFSSLPRADTLDDTIPASANQDEQTIPGSSVSFSENVQDSASPAQTDRQIIGSRREEISPGTSERADSSPSQEPEENQTIAALNSGFDRFIDGQPGLYVDSQSESLGRSSPVGPAQPRSEVVVEASIDQTSVRNNIAGHKLNSIDSLVEDTLGEQDPSPSTQSQRGTTVSVSNFVDGSPAEITHDFQVVQTSPGRSQTPPTTSTEAARASKTQSEEQHLTSTVEDFSQVVSKRGITHSSTTSPVRPTSDSNQITSSEVLASLPTPEATNSGLAAMVDTRLQEFSTAEKIDGLKDTVKTSEETEQRDENEISTPKQDLSQKSVKDPISEGMISTPTKVETDKKLRRSARHRASEVPAILSPWFAPKHKATPTKASTNKTKEPETLTTEQDQSSLNPEQPPKVVLETSITPAPTGDNIEEKMKSTSGGLRTALSYYTSLSALESHLNPSSQSHNTIDVLAVVVSDATKPKQAKTGPRDYNTVLHITDYSLAPKEVQVQIFRPFKSSLPVASKGDVILLRSFVVKSRKRQCYLLSAEASAWHVWRFSKDKSNGKQEGNAAAKAGKGEVPKEECKGPPVEVGDEEREHAAVLRRWAMSDTGVFGL